MQVFSLFIDRPATFIEVINNQNKIEPVVISPNEKYHLTGVKRIILLEDQSFACATEGFIRAIKEQKPDCKVVGQWDTFGTLSVKYKILFQSGLIVNTNSIFHKFYFKDLPDVIERKGLKPDIKVVINSIEDLRPFRDKVLSVAILMGKSN